MRRVSALLLLLAAGFLNSPAFELPPQPEFRLPDVNPVSNRRSAVVSPRDYVFQVSGYYFGAAS